MKNINIITQNYHEFLKYLKSKFSLYHKSNLFLKDIEYGIIHFLEEKNKKVSFREAEKLSQMAIDFLEKENVFKKIDKQTWMLNYPEFTTPKEEKPVTEVKAKV